MNSVDLYDVGDGMTHEHRSRLIRSIADRQFGYVTAKQAEACGYLAKARSIQCVMNGWIRAGKGLYRLPGYPDAKAAEWARWLLWSRNNEEVMLGALCRESALAYFGLRADDSGVTHLSVPLVFRKRGAENGVWIHEGREDDRDVVTEGLFRVISPTKTVSELRELLEQEGTLAELERRAREWERVRSGADPGGGTITDAATGDMGAALGTGDNSGGLTRSGTPPWRQELGEDKNMRLQEPLPRTPAKRDQRVRAYLTSPAGFTLVELLVVVAIITILAALMLPVLKNGVRAAKILSCSNNLRQFAIITSNYRNDNRDRLPGKDSLYMKGSWNATFWGGGYLTDKKLLVCSTESRKDIYSYIPNRYVWASEYDNSLAYCHLDGKVSAVKTNISETIILTECENLWSIYSPSVSGVNWTSGAYHHLTVQARHSDYRPEVFNMPANFLYLDGHAKLERWTGSYNNYSAWDRDLWYHRWRAYVKP